MFQPGQHIENIGAQGAPSLHMTSDQIKKRLHEIDKELAKIKVARARKDIASTEQANKPTNEEQALFEEMDRLASLSV